ncbi:MAG: pilus assembly protein [Rhodospirillales bacterium CG15_BIG_FIL_POST_REV_8_21_14_020_66_15]|nr:MAG: pilus assembly protein [Rhodospirillales bacterium CG15_BIG_FIL_POST_REV_8_21_14_020_66_15]
MHPPALDIFDERPRRRDIKRRNRLILAAGVMLALVMALLFAPSLAAVALAQGRGEGNVEVISPAGANIRMEVNKGRLVRLTRPASTVFIADPRIADVQVKSPSLVYLFAKAPGETTLYAVDQGERVLANVDITVDHNLSRLRDAIAKLAPDHDVRVDSVDGALVVDGVVASASKAEDIRRLAASFAGTPENVINRLGVDAPNQVNLRVRVAEVARDVDKQLGFNWSAIGSIGAFAFGIATANPFAANVITQTLTVDPGRFSAGGGRFTFDVNGVIDALEEEGLVTVLAEPNLTAMSGETASFLAGGEFPILVPEGDNRVVIEFKEFGVSLAFTPTISGDSRINLHVRPEVSQLSNTNAVTLNNFQVPSLTTRRAETTVELGSGQSFAIAGLLQNNVTHSISEFPGLGDVPVLGTLFKSDRFQREESELVIIVTPYIVKPTPTRRLAAPTDGYQAPHDIERIIGGSTGRHADAPAKPKTVTRDGRALIGPVGFTFED